MQVQVRMVAFYEASENKTRTVEIGDVPEGTAQNEILNKVFYWGQNDFQPLECPSVSVGDVIHLDGKYFRVAMCGFDELTEEQYAEYLAVPTQMRYFWKSNSED